MMCGGRAAHFPYQDVDEMLCQQRGSRMRGTSHLKLNTDCRTEWFDLQLAGEGGSDIGGDNANTDTRRHQRANRD